MSNEKTYCFESTPDSKGVIRFVKESELTQPQKDLLLGELIKAFNDMPDFVQQKFLWRVLETIQENNSTGKKDEFKNEIMKKLIADEKLNKNL